MEEKELKKTIESLKEVFGKAFPEKNELGIEKMILECYFTVFNDGELPLEELELVTKVMGYKLTPKFKEELEKKNN